MRHLILSGVLLLMACGIPIESEPEAIDIDVETSPEDDGPPPGERAAASIYLVRDEALVHVTRDLPTPSSPEIIFDSLLDGVTDPEELANLRTAIPPGTSALGVRTEGAALVVDLSLEFVSVGGEEEILAVAQIVLTATSIEGVDRVVFFVEGVPTDVPVASGALSTEPVAADDYASLVGR
jgi:spore germination protein GerM